MPLPECITFEIEMNYTQNILEQIKVFASAGFSAEDIADKVASDNKDEFLAEVQKEGSVLNIIFIVASNKKAMMMADFEFIIKKGEAEKAAAEASQGKLLYGMMNDFCGITDDN